MKKRLFTLFTILGLTAFAQQEAPPQGINYQAVVYSDNGNNQPGLNSPGQVLWNEDIGVQFSILSGSASGTVIYKETHATSTDEFGMFNLVIGQGLVQGTQSFNMIGWGSGYHFLKVEVDKTGGTDYVEMSIQQLWSVPYALYSGYSSSSGYADSAAYADIAGNGLTGVSDNGDGTLTFTYYDGSTYTTAVLSGLGGVGPQGPAGADGQDGLSAYEIWLAQGNTGSEQDFLNSLEGPQGPAGTNGADGTSGVDGQDGQSAYEIWLAQGNSGTEQDFLDSLVGPPGNGSSGGVSKTYVVLAGDLTNAEAQQIFQNDLGPNTQFLWIIGTQQLTSVDLAGFNISELVEIKIIDNVDLTEVLMPDLINVWYNFEVKNNDLLSNIGMPNIEVFYDVLFTQNDILNALDCPSLLTVRGDLDIRSQTGSITITMPALTSISGTFKVEFANENIPFSINVDNLVSVYIIDFDNIGAANELNFPSLTNGGVNISCGSNSQFSLSTINLPSLITGGVNIFGSSGNSAISSINLPMFANGRIMVYYTNISVLDLPNWTSANNGSLNIGGNNFLNQLNTPNVSDISGVSFNNNPLLTDFSFPLQSGFLSINISNSAFNSITSSNIPLVDSLNLSLYQDSSISSINLPNITTFGFGGSSNGIYIKNNSLLQNISFPNLESIVCYNDGIINGTDVINFTQNPLLHTIDLGNLTSANFSVFRAEGQSLTSSTINGLLSDFVNITPSLSGVQINLNGQTPSAPPTGQGITDKATLIANGNTVNTD